MMIMTTTTKGMMIMTTTMRRMITRTIHPQPRSKNWKSRFFSSCIHY